MELDLICSDARIPINRGFCPQQAKKSKPCRIIRWSNRPLAELSLTSGRQRCEILWTNAAAEQVVGMRAAPWGQRISTREYKRFAAEISAVSLKHNVLTISTVTCQRLRAFVEHQHSASNAESLSRWETLTDTQTLFRHKGGGKEKSLLKSLGFGNDQTGARTTDRVTQLLRIPVPTHGKHSMQRCAWREAFWIIQYEAGQLSRPLSRAVVLMFSCSSRSCKYTNIKDYKLTTSYSSSQHMLYVIVSTH